MYLKGQQLSRFRWGDDGIVYDGDRQIKAGACFRHARKEYRDNEGGNYRIITRRELR